MATQKDILVAISLEKAAVPEFYTFHITGTAPEGPVWKVFVDVRNSRTSSLDESFEGSRAWWGGEPTGTADVLSVDPEREQINLRFASKPPPGVGETLRIYPPQFLQPLYDCWHNHHWAERCLQWLKDLRESNRFDPAAALDPASFPWLRARQRDAFKLPGWNASFLWGPPGTGKTTTLGALLASYLLQFPEHKVLLFSTTNSAVDLALIAVDEALAGLGRTTQPTRNRCQRLGNHFIARNYEHRKHLLPVADEELVTELARLESARPDPQNVSAYAAWRSAVDQLRAEARRRATEVLQDSQLVALTTARGVYSFEDLRLFAPFDLVVFDESSQVTLPHALALAPLGRHVIFAGDPRQLAPIVRSDEPRAQRWMGQSIFEYMDEDAPSTCMLVEQSRMAAPVCELVSYLFYGKRLVVAEAEKNDPKWLALRRPNGLTARCRRNVHLEEIATEGTWSQQYQGPIRYQSAELINEIVQELLARNHTQENDILIVTPFRAQRALIRTFPAQRGLASGQCQHRPPRPGQRTPHGHIRPRGWRQRFPANRRCKAVDQCRHQPRSGPAVRFSFSGGSQKSIASEHWHPNSGR